MLLACAAIAHGQKTYPSINSDSYAAAKFALGLPPATSSISTVEGNSTVLIQSYFEVQGVPQVGVSGLNRGFVEAYGTSFTVNGKPYFCGGTNAYYAGLKWIMSDNEVAVMMKVHSNRGANVLRVFAHSNFNSVPSPMMPLIGVYNEDAIERLDLMLVAAAQNGIRIIMVLVRYHSLQHQAL